MEWVDEAIVLGARAHGDRDAIAVLMTFEHGKHAGLIRGGQGAAMRPVLEVGNRVEATWKARLAEHLGAFRLETVRQPAAAVLDRPLELAGLASACAVVDLAMGERDPHPRVFAALARLVETIGHDPGWLADYVRFELLLLGEAGFGVDLTICAVSGATEGLAYVSPRTGRAVTAEAGEPYAQKLLVLPSFLVEDVDAEGDQLSQGLRLAGYFLDRHIALPNDRALPLARERLFRLVAERSAGAHAVGRDQESTE